MNKKSRYWAYIIYPDGVPNNWVDILQKKGLQVAVSPLHDKDINEMTQEAKKSHYHLIVNFGGPTTYAVAQSIAQELNCPIPQIINSVVGAVRYLTHRDNPEKYQYDKKDITLINGFDIKSYDLPTITEKYLIKKNIAKLIRDESVCDYGLLLEILEDKSDAWWIVASENTYFFKTLTDTQYRKKKKML